MSRCSGYGYDCGDASAHPENRYREPDEPVCKHCSIEYAEEGSDYCEDCEAYHGGPDE